MFKICYCSVVLRSVFLNREQKYGRKSTIQKNAFRAFTKRFSIRVPLSENSDSNSLQFTIKITKRPSTRVESRFVKKIQVESKIRKGLKNYFFKPFSLQIICEKMLISELHSRRHSRTAHHSRAHSAAHSSLAATASTTVSAESTETVSKGYYEITAE